MQLGVQRGTVKLVAYQQEWKLAYEREKVLLSAICQDTALDIQHIGSTSVEGLSAKPIIDIAIKVKSLTLDNAIFGQLILNHYKERTNRLGKDQLVYVKGLEDNETHYLHIIPAYNPDWNHKLEFRDYLKARPDRMQAYELLKRTLSQRFATDRGSYTRGKDEFIRQVLFNRLP